MKPAAITRRPYQREVLRLRRKLRLLILLWRRQGGKSTTLSECGLISMMENPGRLVTYASASLLLGREIVLKEAAVMRRAVDAALQQAAAVKLDLKLADSHSHRELGMDLGMDDFADLFETQRLEFRLYHTRTTFSRTQVIAPNPATARGWTGDVFLDEFGFIRDFRDLWEAVEPIVSTDPDFRLLMATTPPKDDAHYSFELTNPVVGAEFPVNPAGNLYRSESGKQVHRVDIHDAYAAGVKLFDLDTGKELSPEEHFRQADDKDAWRRNYGVVHVLGGTSAVGLLVLDTAMRRGLGQCAHIAIDQDGDLDRAIRFLLDHIGGGSAGIGWDLATTTKESSNPSAVAVVEQDGVDLIVRLVLTWKTRDPALAMERIERIVDAVASRAKGGRARRLCIDATNERYFSETARRELAGKLPVELVVGSETTEPPGAEEPLTMKQYLGGQLVAELEDNHVTLPPERYIKEDFRLVKLDRGSYVCDPAPDGKHGDTFDAVKLGLRALRSSGGAITTTRGIRVGNPAGRLTAYRPLRWRAMAA